MKTNRFKTLWCATLSLILLVSAAVPFAAQAQAEATPEQKADATDAPEELWLELRGAFDERGKDIFVFEGKTIQYRNVNGRKAEWVEINRIPWNDLSVPFQLDFTPDFEKAYFQSERKQLVPMGGVKLTPEKDKFELAIEMNRDKESLTRRILRIAVKNQRVKRYPAISNNPDDGSTGNVTTNGFDHPGYPVTDILSPLPNFRNRVSIKGTVDKEAGFRIQGELVSYLNYRPMPTGFSGGNRILFDGLFASDVTVNEKEWSNLTKPFTMDSPKPIMNYRKTIFRAENCSLEFTINGDAIEVIIHNDNKKPTPFEVQLHFAY